MLHQDLNPVALFNMKISSSRKMKIILLKIVNVIFDYQSSDSMSILNFLSQITLLQMEHNFDIVSMMNFYRCTCGCLLFYSFL